MILTSIDDIINIYDNNNKYLYGEVPTPKDIINKLLNNIPESNFYNVNLKWLDPGCGNGYISIYLYFILFDKLRNNFNSDIECRDHIVKNMIYMIDINEENIKQVRSLFSYKENIICGDFLQYEPDMRFDIIVTNPPYNFNGKKKVPTSNGDKRSDGTTLWPLFIKKCLNLLKKDGYLSTIIPSIWMKYDNIMNSFIKKYQIYSLYTYNNTETNKIFKGHAQTPTSLFVLKNTCGENKIEVYDKCFNKMVYLNDYKSIPVFGAFIIKKLEPFLRKYGNLYNTVIKTNMPSTKNSFSNVKTHEFCYENISTCKIKDKTQPYLIVNYSNKPCNYYNKPKLVCAHKMYGFPYYDVNGEYGISNRDNYVITGYSNNDFIRLKAFLDSKLVFYIIESTRYRMKYLEKQAFEFIINICNIEDFPEKINDKTIFEYFEFKKEEVERIKLFCKNEYNCL